MYRFVDLVTLAVALAPIACAGESPRSDGIPLEGSAPASSATLAPEGAPPRGATSGGVRTPDLPSGDACEATADCALSHTYLIDGKCCGGTCPHTPVSTQTLAAIEEQCAVRGYEIERCPERKCAPPPPIACRNHRCVLAEPTGPITSGSDAVERAVTAANSALDGAYAKYSSRPGVVAPAHPSAWVSGPSANVKGPAADGSYRIEWSVYPPAGFGYKAIVLVEKDGRVTVEAAEAEFSPD